MIGQKRLKYRTIVDLSSFSYSFLALCQGDTLENVAKQLDCITTTGNYLFLTSDTTSSGALLNLEYSPSQHSSLKDPVNVQCWNSEHINDFVRKLGFLDTEKEGGYKIKHFLHINEVCISFGTVIMSIRIIRLFSDSCCKMTCVHNLFCFSHNLSLNRQHISCWISMCVLGSWVTHNTSRTWGKNL